MRYYIGIDLHMQFSTVAVMDQDGNILKEHKFYHTNKKELFKFFASFPTDATSISLEATFNWYWLVDTLQELGYSVKLVNAKKVRIIAESTIKTDKIDAKTLAHLDRCNFLPQAYIADVKIRSQRELLRHYMGLVRIRSSIKCKIHSILAKNNVQHGFTDLFGKAGMKFLKEVELPKIFRMQLDEHLEILSDFKERTYRLTRKIERTCEHSKYAKRLMTVPGIAHFTALLLSSEIADINRFRNYKKFCCYAGLASSTRQSADKKYHGHIIKDSNSYIRYALVEAVPKAIHKDSKLWVFYKRIQRKKGNNKARIATARRILIAIYSMLKNNTDYRITERKDFTQVISKVRLGATAATL